MSLLLRLNIDKDKHGGDVCILGTTSGTVTTSPGDTPHVIRDEVLQLDLYFYDTSSGSAVAYSNAEITGATFSFRSDGIPASSASGFAWDGGAGKWSGELDLTTILTSLDAFLADAGEKSVIFDFVFTTSGGEVYAYRVNVIFHDHADDDGSGTVGPFLPAGYTFAESPVGHFWVMKNGEPHRNITEPGTPWEG